MILLQYCLLAALALLKRQVKTKDVKDS